MPLPSRQAILNKNIMREISVALASDPEANILSMIPSSYELKIKKASTRMSAIARLNCSTIDELQSMAREDPEIDLLSHFPEDYHTEYNEGQENPVVKKYQLRKKSRALEKDTLSRLSSASTASIVCPLSDVARRIIPLQSNDIPELLTDSECLAASLKSLFGGSEKLYEYGIRGAVFKCSNELVAKVITGLHDSTEYTSMRFLEECAPDIPAPRPHGLIRIGHYWAILMTYIPSRSLEGVWPSLCLEQKAQIRDQVNDIMIRLRDIKRPDGYPLGGVGRQGAKDAYDEVYRSKDIVETASKFLDFKFGNSRSASDAYIKFLRGLLPSAKSTQIVFTHGDLRPANIMVKMDEDQCIITGIVDWEDSGFYPDFHEATKCTRLLNHEECSDWYEYLPPCVAPASYPHWWLADRVWRMSVAIAG